MSDKPLGASREERVPSAVPSAAPVSGTTQINPTSAARPSGVVASATVPVSRSSIDSEWPSTDDIDSEWTSDDLPPTESEAPRPPILTQPSPADQVRASAPVPVQVPRAPAVPVDLRAPSTDKPAPAQVVVAKTPALESIAPTLHSPSSVPETEIKEKPVEVVVQSNPSEKVAAFASTLPSRDAPQFPQSVRKPEVVSPPAAEAASESAVQIKLEKPAPVRSADQSDAFPQVPVKGRGLLWGTLLIAAAAAAGGIWYMSKMKTTRVDAVKLQAATPAPPAASAVDPGARPNPLGLPEPRAEGLTPQRAAELARVVQQQQAEAAARAASEAAAAASASAALPAEPAKISILLKVRPPEARVFHRGKEVGKPPLTIELAPGERRAFEVALEGYTTRKVVLDGSKTELNIGLNPIPQE